jgi:hypothetical protein
MRYFYLQSLQKKLYLCLCWRNSIYIFYWYVCLFYIHYVVYYFVFLWLKYKYFQRYEQSCHCLVLKNIQLSMQYIIYTYRLIFPDFLNIWQCLRKGPIMSYIILKIIYEVKQCLPLPRTLLYKICIKQPLLNTKYQTTFTEHKTSNNLYWTQNIKQPLMNTKLFRVIPFIYLLHVLVTTDHPWGKYLEEK